VAVGALAGVTGAEPTVRAASTGAADPDERDVTFDPLQPIIGDEFAITISGWPAACPSVELHLLDGSVAAPDAGDVLASWGTVLLVDGAGTTTVVAGGSDEYNLEVAGAVEDCGAPYYTPDFGFVAPPSPPSTAGAIRAEVVPEALEIIRVDASGWPSDCEALRVVAAQGGGAVGLGRIDLVGGAGTLSVHASVLSTLVPSFEYDVEAYTAEDDESGDPVTGPSDACGGVAITTLEIPEGWTPPASPSTTGNGETTPPGSPTAPPASGTLPGTGGSGGGVVWVAASTVLAGLALLAVRHRRSVPDHPGADVDGSLGA
jgi:hypothetical protein